MATCAAVILAAPAWMWVRASSKKTQDARLLACSEFFSLFPGLAGVYLRRGFHCMALEHCAWDVHIEFGTWFAHCAARIGERVYIGGRCTLGMVEIGPDVLIGSNVDILSGRRQHSFATSDSTISRQGGAFERVRIGADVWIGNGAVILASIGDHGVVGAGAVVVKPVRSWSVVVGNPARTVRDRRSNGERQELSMR